MTRKAARRNAGPSQVRADAAQRAGNGAFGRFPGTLDIVKNACRWHRIARALFPRQETGKAISVFHYYRNMLWTRSPNSRWGPFDETTMTLLTLTDAAFVAHAPLFQDLTLTLNPGDRIGLVAQNGAGKSTLLRCLAGQLDLGAGAVRGSRGTRIGFMTQDVGEDLRDLSFRAAVLDALPRDAAESEGWRADMVLDSFDAPEDIRDLPVAKLSGGWQRLMLLARLWVTDPDILLLDEPTNHLDLEKILMLETWLDTWAGRVPLVVASHDRDFLDAVTNRTLFLRPGTSHLCPLPYSQAKHELARIDRTEAAERERGLKQAQQLRRQSAKLKNIGINSGSDLLLKKQKQLRDRADRIEGTVNALHRDRTAEIKLATGGTHAKALIRIEDLRVTTPDGRMLFTVPELNVLPDDRIVLLGRNGVGKSTLLRLLQGVLTGTAELPGIRVTPSLVLGRIDQALSDMPLKQTPYDFVTQLDLTDARARASLAAAGIAHDWQHRPIRELSLGQRSRLALLALRFAQPNFYLLDEPTTHLDIAGQEALAEEIRDRGASCLLVSHDRAFVRDVGTRFFRIENRRIEEVASPDGYFEGLRG